MKYLAAIIPCLLLYSCKDTFEKPATDTSNFNRYFPLMAGKYCVYAVDSIVHETADDKTNNPDSLKTYYHFEIKEQIDSFFMDGEGEKAWYFSRYKRSSDTADWQFINVWTAKLNSSSAQTVEDNIRYIKLAFPPVKNKSWNGNACNDLPDEEYSYSEINTPLTIGAFEFDSSLTVIQNQDANLLYTVLKQEKYAVGAGMILRQKDSLNLNALYDITNGYEYKMVLKDYYPK